MSEKLDELRFFEEDRRQSKFDTALNMLEKVYPIESIKECTLLDEYTINVLKKKIDG
ncbi:MAG: hypothetical protein LBD41_01895 [Clostridiales Family XIII bacterium]|jgi:hypothetical protein|nr:hypothetical protein [Clostridiales Family XIII bacterium]